MGLRPATRAAWLALAALTACATVPRTFQCPTAGGPPWRQLASDAYVLRTDLPVGDAAELLGHVERLREAVVAGLPGGAPAATGRVEIVAFRTLEEFRPFAPYMSLGYYVRQEGGPPRIVVPGEIGPWQRAMLAHEITHDLLARTYLRQPRWFAEGLAVYMESVEVNGAGTEVTVGQAPALRAQQLRRMSVTLPELLAWDGSPPDRPGMDYYASAWILVHWLVHERPQAFERLRAHLVRGDDPALAWRDALPEADPSLPGALGRLEATLDRYAAEPVATATRAARPLPVVAYSEQPIPTPEVHAIRLTLWRFRPVRSESELRGEVNEALAEDPAHPIALEYLAVLDRLDPAPMARRSVEGHPGDPRAYTFLAHSLTGPEDGPEREAAYRKALELSPRNPAAYFNLGQEIRAGGRPEEALPFLRQAAALAPWSTQVLAGYGAALADLGRCQEAEAATRSALDAMPERSTPIERRNVQERLTGLLGKCAVGVVDGGAEPRPPGRKRADPGVPGRP